MEKIDLMNKDVNTAVVHLKNALSVLEYHKTDNDDQANGVAELHSKEISELDEALKKVQESNKKLKNLLELFDRNSFYAYIFSMSAIIVTYMSIQPFLEIFVDYSFIYLSNPDNLFHSFINKDIFMNKSAVIFSLYLILFIPISFIVYWFLGLLKYRTTKSELRQIYEEI